MNDEIKPMPGKVKAIFTVNSTNTSLLLAECAQMLVELEWAGEDYIGPTPGGKGKRFALKCPNCDTPKPEGHYPTCSLAALLARLREAGVL